MSRKVEKYEKFDNNYVVNAELKPLYAFILALMADVFTLENQSENLKSRTFNLKGDIFKWKVPFVGKFVGTKNLLFAGATALGVAVGENIGLWAFPHSALLDDNDHLVREKITWAFEIVTATLLNFVTRGAIDDGVLLRLWLPKSLLRSFNAGDARRVAVSPDDTIFPRLIEFVSNDSGVGGESVLQNYIKLFFTTLGVVSATDRYQQLFEFKNNK